MIKGQGRKWFDGGFCYHATHEHPTLSKEDAIQPTGRGDEGRNKEDVVSGALNQRQTQMSESQTWDAQARIHDFGLNHDTFPWKDWRFACGQWRLGSKGR